MFSDLFQISLDHWLLWWRRQRNRIPYYSYRFPHLQNDVPKIIGGNITGIKTWNRSKIIKKTMNWCIKRKKNPGIYIYIYISILGPVKPELGVIPSGQEVIHEWIFKIFLHYYVSSLGFYFIKKIWRSPVIFFVFLEISKMRSRIRCFS